MQYRNTLSSHYKRRFDIFWGIDTNTNTFINDSYYNQSSLTVKYTTSKKGLDIPNIILNKIIDIRRQVENKFNDINSNINSNNNTSSNNHLLVLLLRDLLSSPLGMVGLY